MSAKTSPKTNEVSFDSRFDAPSHPSSQPLTPWRLSGPKQKYSDTYPITLYNSLKKGETLSQIASSLSISRQTLLNYINDIPDMKEAHSLGTTAFEAHYDTILQNSMYADSSKGQVLPETNPKLMETFLKRQTMTYKEKEPEDTSPTSTITQTADLVSQLNKFADTLLTKKETLSLQSPQKEPIDITPDNKKE